LKNLKEVQEKNVQDNLQNEIGVNEEIINLENKQTTNYSLSANNPPNKQLENKSVDENKLEPEQANQLVGRVTDSQGQSVNNALLEIFANDQDQALRIIKTNAAGQFYIKTALPNGEYLIKTEAEGLVFSPLSIRLTGKIVPSIKIIAD
jgi:protocatechuate 3,4-dioxygenase beta subunit